jgi:hypothetical protein
MAWPGSLTEEEQAIVQVHVDQLIRPAILRVVQAMNTTVGVKDDYTDRVSALLTTLSGTDIVPNLSGLAGAEALTVDEIDTMLTGLNAMLATYNTVAKRATYRPVIGSVNMQRE